MGRFLTILSLLPALAVACSMGPEVPQSCADCARCDAACDAWQRHGCIEGAPSATGVPCSETCLRTLEYEPLPLECIAAAESCDAARACEEEAP